MAKFENDLDLPKATRIVKGKKKEIDKLVLADKDTMSAIDKLVKQRNALCYIFSKSIAFRVGRSSVKTIPSFPAGFKSSFPGSSVAKQKFFPLNLPSPKKRYTKYEQVYLTACYFLLYENKRVKSENDKTEAVESEQVLKVQNDLKKLIKEYGSVRLKVGKVKYDVDDFKQVPGRPKADMIFTLKGKPVIFVSHKKGNQPAAFQQYGGFAADLGIKVKDDAKKYPEVFKFLDDVDMTLKGLGVSKDNQGRYDLNDLRKGSNMARMIFDEKVAYTVMFGKDYGSSNPGLDNCSIILDGDIIFKPIRTNTFELKGSFHTKIHPLLDERRMKHKSSPGDVYSPVMFILKSEQQGLKQAGLTNARAVIWPNNKIAQGYTKQFEDMFKGVKSGNKSKIKTLKEEYRK